MRLSRAQRHVLRAMARESFLKSHRDLDGAKHFMLHSAGEGPEIVKANTVAALRELGLIDSNKKFPVATFWLTQQGRAVAAES